MKIEIIKNQYNSNYRIMIIKDGYRNFLLHVGHVNKRFTTQYLSFT
jgi:hypothetical protein